MSKVVTVRELQRILSEVEDQDLEVHLDGCDCSGPASGKFEVHGPFPGDPSRLLLLLRGDGR